MGSTTWVMLGLGWTRLEGMPGRNSSWGQLMLIKKLPSHQGWDKGLLFSRPHLSLAGMPTSTPFSPSLGTELPSNGVSLASPAPGHLFQPKPFYDSQHSPSNAFWRSSCSHGSPGRSLTNILNCHLRAYCKCDPLIGHCYGSLLEKTSFSTQGKPLRKHWKCLKTTQSWYIYYIFIYI